MKFHEAPDQHEPDPEPALRMGQRAIGLTKQVEYARQELEVDAGAGIPDSEASSG